MGLRKVVVKQGAAEKIAAIAWYIESFGLIETVEKFADDAYDFFIKMVTNASHTPHAKKPVVLY